MNTVNVIEMNPQTHQILQLLAFPDNADGNQMAERIFTKLAQKLGASETEIENALDDGYFEEDGYFKHPWTYLALVHSTNEN